MDQKVGSVIAMDVNNGEILAMISRPSFDPSEFGKGVSQKYWSSLLKDENNPLRDRNIQEHFSPGSTFKTISAIAGLEEGIIDEKTETFCNGSFKMGTRRVHCWKKEGHGKVNVVKALRESCDVFFYKLATQMDINILAKYAFLFGLGKKTGIDLPRETTGLIPTREWKRKNIKEEWQGGETLSVMIGQSFVLTTPIQLLQAYAALANGGKIYRPHYIKEVFNNDGEILKKGEGEVVSSFRLKPKTLEIVKKGLFEVVNSPHGTAYSFRGEGINMVGKTGTSQVVRLSQDKIYLKCEQLNFKYRHNGLFVGFGPADDPKIAVAVVVEHGCHGSSAAAPVARDIIAAYMKKYHGDLLAKYLKTQKKDNLVRVQEDE
jgi:penicillin-binding protein 2